MRIIFMLFLLVFGFESKAGCNFIANLYSENLYIDISDGGCGPETMISFTTKIDKDGQPNYEFVKSFPFDKECNLKVDKNGEETGLYCYPKGHTPLAGATYKRVKDGKSLCEIEKEKIYIQAYKYVCIKACRNGITPKYLYHDGMDGCD